MSCPVHIWVPMMAAAAPFVRVARDKMRALRPAKAATASEPGEIHRWAPVGAPPAASEAEPAAR